MGGLRVSGRRALVLADQAAVSGAGFLTAILLVRALGLETFGVYSLVWLVVVFAVSLQQALVSQPLTTLAPKTADGERPAYRAAVLRLELAFSALVALAAGGGYAFFLAHWDAPGVRGTWLPVVLAVVARQAHGFARSAYFADGRRGRALAIDLIAYPGQVIALAVSWASGHLDLAAAFWCVAGASGAGALVGLAGYSGRGARPAPLRATAARHWGFSRWLTAMALAQWFASNSFLVAAGLLLGAGAVGAIKAAQTVLGVLHVFFLAMENVVPVSAARLLAAEGPQRMRAYLASVLWTGLAGTLLVSLAIGVVPELVLRPLYRGEVTAELVFALRGLALMYVCAFLITVLQIGFRTLENTRAVFLAYLANTAVAVLVAQPVVEAFGFEGAVLGVVGQQALMATLLASMWFTGASAPTTSARSSSA